MAEKQRKYNKKAVTLKDGLSKYMQKTKIVDSNGKELPSSQTAKKRIVGLLASWREVVSERIFEHTDNVVYSTRSKDTEILVFVDSAIYSAELSMDKELYRHKMQKVLGKEIHNITFLVSRKSAFRKNPKK